MKIKIFNLLTVTLATLGLLAPPTSAFGSHLEPQTGIKQAQPLKGDIAHRREWTQNQRLVQKLRSCTNPWRIEFAAIQTKSLRVRSPLRRETLLQGCLTAYADSQKIKGLKPAKAGFVCVAATYSRQVQDVRKDKSVAVASQTTQSSQQNLARQTSKSMSFLAGIFVTFVIIGFILGCLLQYRQYKKDYAKRRLQINLEIETLEKIRFLQIENLERLEKMKSGIDQTIIPQREKQIESLERIWKMKS